jgi:hypothetical protein
MYYSNYDMLSNPSRRFYLLHSFDSDCSSVHPDAGRQTDVAGGGGLGEHSLCLPDISDGVFIFTGSSEILLNSSLWALRSSLSFNPPTLHYPLPSFVFIKFCLTGGRSDKIVYEKLAVSVASVLVVTMYVLICLCEGYLVIM